jgi:SAM-dependent methyltransferase
MELNLVTGLHRATQRDYLGRMNDSKVEAMKIAKQYGFDYWDGHRRFGYGGYKYIPGRWRTVAKKLIDLYGLKAGSKILDVGCGKGFLLYEIQLIEPKIEIYGFDISQYGLENTHPELRAKLFIHRAQEKFPFEDNFFDLVISLGTLHNLHIFELEIAVSEIERLYHGRKFSKRIRDV